MELQYRSGSTYTLTLNLYFDAINGNPGALDQQLTASIFDKVNNRRMQNVSLPLVGNTFVQYTNPACTSASLSTRKLVYSREIILDADLYTSTAGYYAAIERCCRNNGISNIVSPGAAAQTFYLEFPAVVRNRQRFIDSTPRIFPPLGDYACKGEMFYYDFSGQDADGDSLAYDLVTPLNGSASDFDPAPFQASPAPYRLINWKPGLSTTNQIPGAPTLTIDARTGRLMVRPSQLGLFVFGVRCTEYRNKVKIGETRRDFQLYTLDCPRNTKPSLQVFNQVGGRAYQPKLDTLRLIPGGNRCITMRFTDPDAGSRLTLTTLPVNFSGLAPTFTTTTTGTVHAPGAPDTLSATLCFPECQDTQGKVYLLDVIVADNGCSLPKKDTIRVAFTAIPPANTPPVLTSTFPSEATPATTPIIVRIPVGATYTADLTGTDADGNPLTMTAVGQRFDLAAAGMRFTAQNGTGRANGTFTWLASCEAAQLQDNLTVTFQLQETVRCTPKPQTRTVQFMVVPAPDTTNFLPPNIITPNGDGKNDAFELTQLPPDLCDGRFGGIKIFSRWGNEVFHSPARTFRWNGSGSAGVYYYLITFTDGRRYKGWLQVLP
ncbi:gliding motility-associated C-terminal domain-containing protein [Hymenobacter gelipurpurascens]|uniref:Gliding motility-associated C-terminal domain-containing protein n=2 Tax=Hymenobacter gelipurpurascens TaxID=89968 RepID=A0A212T526_9BACT|nr:gliding motility-associated C-terminal domain-containing protein [Hymenobacter gelipurpurascens]